MSDAILTTPITGRALWASSDFQNDDWIWHLTAAEIADLDQAFHSVQARGAHLKKALNRRGSPEATCGQ